MALGMGRQLRHGTSQRTAGPMARNARGGPAVPGKARHGAALARHPTVLP
jgi:hypothetical protein